MSHQALIDKISKLILEESINMSTLVATQTAEINSLKGKINQLLKNQDLPKYTNKLLELADAVDYMFGLPHDQRCKHLTVTKSGEVFGSHKAAQKYIEELRQAGWKSTFTLQQEELAAQNNKRFNQ